jgi:hypothetical protein
LDRRRIDRDNQLGRVWQIGFFAGLLIWSALSHEDPFPPLWLNVRRVIRHGTFAETNGTLSMIRRRGLLSQVLRVGKRIDDTSRPHESRA